MLIGTITGLGNYWTEAFLHHIHVAAFHHAYSLLTTSSNPFHHEFDAQRGYGFHAVTYRSSSLAIAKTHRYFATMNHWPRAILFDFDGVIVNSEPLHFQAFQKVLEAEKILLSEEEYYRELIGFDDRGAFQHLLHKQKIKFEPKEFSRLMQRKSEMVTKLMNEKKYQALPGVEKFVRGVRRHYPLAICSGALRGEIETMLEGVGLRDCFRTIIAAEDVTVGKPDPQGYLLCMKELSQKANVALTSQDCLVIEDAPSVIKSVKSVGFQTLGVATSHDIAQLGEANWKVNTLDPAEVLKQLPKLKLEI